MKAEDTTFYSDLFKLIRDVWSPTIVALVSYFMYRLNLKIKEVEIKGQTTLKARELMFNAYQQRLGKLNEDIREFAESIGKYDATLLSNDGKDETIKDILELISNFIGYCRHSIDSLIDEVKKHGLLDERRERHVEFIRKVFSMDLAKMSPEETRDIYQKFVRGILMLISFEADLVEKKQKELFSKYLND